MKPIFNWWLRNPAHLFGPPAGLAVLWLLMSHVDGSHAHHPAPKPVVHATARSAPAPTSTSTTTVPATTTTTTVPVTTTTSSTTTTLPPRQSLPAAASRAATTFIDTWADRNLPPAVWHRRIAALVTTAEQPGFAATNYPTAVPVGVRIVGAPIGSGDSGGAEVQVLTNKGLGELMLAVVDGRWLVTYFDI